MSKTRKVRRARLRAERAEAARDKALLDKKATEVATAKARGAYRLLTHIVGELGHENLFYAMVHGVQHSDVRPLNHELKVRELKDLNPRTMEAMAHSARIDYFNTKNLGLLQTIVREQDVGSILTVEYMGRPSLAVDTKALENIPERFLAQELGEIFAEEIKRGNLNVQEHR